MQKKKKIRKLYSGSKAGKYKGPWEGLSVGLSRQMPQIYIYIVCIQNIFVHIYTHRHRHTHIQDVNYIQLIVLIDLLTAKSAHL